jgi:hypothetical protein
MNCEDSPRMLVRNVETERRRRLYKSFRLEALLEEKGLTSSDFPPDYYLPLEIFDDEEFDCR